MRWAAQLASFLHYPSILEKSELEADRQRVRISCFYRAGWRTAVNRKNDPTFTHFHAETAMARRRSTTLPCRAIFASKRNRITLMRFLSRTFDMFASFGYNEPEGGEFVMKREKRYLVLDSFEWRLAIVGMNHFRNNLLRTGKPTEDVDSLLLNLVNAKSKRRE